ncbi:hypothetical protein ACG0Z6_11030 [Roseateles sp. BYS180W]|uniref:Uncharacterized protein n=1 Tax=Roseateles rivi TaxID=3299028 RepID=A0ABW7FWQ3_9BURK
MSITTTLLAGTDTGSLIETSRLRRRLAALLLSLARALRRSARSLHRSRVHTPAMSSTGEITFVRRAGDPAGRVFLDGHLLGELPTRGTEL